MAKLPNYYKVRVDGLKVKLDPIYEEMAEVVRCKDCKYWNLDGNGYSDDESHCTNPDGLDNYAMADDFCSYGERKEA